MQDQLPGRLAENENIRVAVILLTDLGQQTDALIQAFLVSARRNRSGAWVAASSALKLNALPVHGVRCGPQLRGVFRHETINRAAIRLNDILHRAMHHRIRRAVGIEVVIGDGALEFRTELGLKDENSSAKLNTLHREIAHVNLKRGEYF